MTNRLEAVPAITDDDLTAARIGARVRARRAEHGWSVAELAHRVGMADAVVSNIEDGVRLPTIEIIYRLATGLRTPPGELLPSPEERPRVAVHLPILDGPDSSTAQIIGGGPGNATQTYLFEMHAGESDGGFGAHPGDELLVVIEGEVVVFMLDRPDLLIAAGGSLVVETSVPHGFRASDAGPARFLIVHTDAPIA